MRPPRRWSDAEQCWAWFAAWLVFGVVLMVLNGLGL
jgi:hypothetical protein